MLRLLCSWECTDLHDKHLWNIKDLPGSRVAGSLQTGGEPVLQPEVEGHLLPEFCLPGTSVHFSS